MLQQYFPNMPAAISADAGLLILRIVVGLLFIGHGLQKLTGWFGGHGIAGTAGFFGMLGLRPARFWAVMAGLAEALGGAGLVLGMLTPFAAAAIIAVMLSAIGFVHWSKGIWVTNGGYEYNLVLLASAVVMGLMGAGGYSLDAYLSQQYGYSLPLTTVQAFIVGAALAVIVFCVEVLFTRRGQRAAVSTGQRGGAAAPTA